MATCEKYFAYREDLSLNRFGIPIRGSELTPIFGQILVGMCSTAGASSRPVTFMVPDGRGMAKASLDAVGCGRREIWAYWPHALQFGIMGALPGFVLENFGATAIKQVMEEERERKGLGKKSE